MLECPIYYVSNTSTTSSPPPDDISCSGCNCGYIQYEHLIPFLKELNDKIGEDDYNDLEFKLRQQILEVSRLFDMEAGVDPGYFSKAHYTTTKVFRTDGTKFLKVPDFVSNTLEVRTMTDVVLDPVSYRYENQHLVYRPCDQHITCGCFTGCGNVRVQRILPWPDTCYQLTARWGNECADPAVQMAVRDYLTETYRMQDPIKVLASGLQAQRNFSVPHSWRTYLDRFKQKKHFFGRYAIA